MDAFSRFPEAYPVRDLTATALITKFRDFFSRYGLPDAILSDNGPQYRSREFVNYLQPFNIRKLLTNGYRPSSNGLCERFNGTLQKKMVSSARVRSWALLLDASSPHSVDGDEKRCQQDDRLHPQPALPVLPSKGPIPGIRLQTLSLSQSPECQSIPPAPADARKTAGSPKASRSSSGLPTGRRSSAKWEPRRRLSINRTNTP